MTSLQEADVLAIVAGTTKVIEGDIVWQPEDNVWGAQQFRMRVTSVERNDLLLRGWFNNHAGKLTYTLFIP